MSLVQVATDESCHYLLEVDTSDVSKGLSTTETRTGVIVEIESGLYEIERQLLKASLSLPKAQLDKLVGGDNYSWMLHRKSKKGGRLTVD